MRGSWRLITSSLTLGVVVCLGCGPELPEYYGIYLKSGSDYEEIQRPGVPDVTDGQPYILVYDKAVSGSTTELVALTSAVSRRYEVETLLDSVEAEDGMIQLHSRKEILPAPGEAGVTLRSRPMRDNPEMIEFSPAQPLPAGIYWLTIGDRTSALFVGVKPEDAFSATNPGCLDRHVATVNIDRNFSWTAFRRLAASGPSGSPRSASGRVIMREKSVPCSDGDAYLEDADIQARLASFSSYRLHTALHTLLDLLSEQSDLGLETSWKPLNHEKIGRAIINRRGGSRGTSWDQLDAVDAWGQPLEAIFIRSSGQVALRSSGSDRAFQDEYTARLLSSVRGESQGDGLVKIVPDGDYAADIVLVGEKEPPFTWIQRGRWL